VKTASKGRGWKRQPAGPTSESPPDPLSSARSDIAGSRVAGTGPGLRQAVRVRSAPTGRPGRAGRLGVVKLHHKLTGEEVTTTSTVGEGVAPPTAARAHRPPGRAAPWPAPSAGGGCPKGGKGQNSRTPQTGGGNERVREVHRDAERKPEQLVGAALARSGSPPEGARDNRRTTGPRPHGRPVGQWPTMTGARAHYAPGGTDAQRPLALAGRVAPTARRGPHKREPRAGGTGAQYQRSTSLRHSRRCRRAGPRMRRGTWSSIRPQVSVPRTARNWCDTSIAPSRDCLGRRESATPPARRSG